MKVLPAVQDQTWIDRTLGTLSAPNQTMCEGFLAEVAAQGTKVKTRENYLYAIQSLERLGKPYRDLTKKDILEWVQWVDTTMGKNTAKGYKIVIKRFLRWVHTGKLKGEYPECVEFIKIKRFEAEDLIHKVMSKEEIRRIIDATESKRDRALLFVLYESGARVGELVGVRLQDVKFSDQGVDIWVKGKTGERPIPLFDSEIALREWISEHPYRAETDAALWVGKRSGKNSMAERQVQTLVRKYADKAGIKRRITPHCFRHSRATHLAAKYPESILRGFFGWSPGSKMPSWYIHWSMRDIAKAMREGNGSKPKPPENPLKPRVCRWCQFENSVGAAFCGRCARPLDEATAIKFDSMRKEVDGVTALVMQKVIDKAPEILEQILREPEINSKIQELQRAFKSEKSVGRTK